MARPGPVVAAIVTIACGWLVPAASATDYCVAPNTTCGGTNVATFQDALDQADNNNNADRLFLGAATYTAPTATGFSYTLTTGPVEIIGAGMGQTILTGQIGGTNRVLRLEPAAGSSIHDLTVRLPQNVAFGLAGLETFAPASRIEVVEAPSQANGRVGVRLEGPAATLSDSTVTLERSTGVIGVRFVNGGQTLRDSIVTAGTAINSHGGTVDHCTLTASFLGVEATLATTTLTDTLIKVTDDGSSGFYVNVDFGVNTTVNADGLTIIGAPGPDDVGVYASNSVASAQTAAVHLVDTILRDFDHSLSVNGVAAGTATITTSYSDYDSSADQQLGNGTITPTNHTNAGDAKFVDPAGGDFRLRFDSPLVDIGEPVDPTTTTDLAGGARQVDGDLAGGARRDIGAYEYQARAPIAVNNGPATAQTGQQVTFSSAGSSDPDPGDTLAFAWTVDGAPAGTGASLDTTLQSAGMHTVALTVTDPIGRQATASRTIEVSAAPASGGGTTTPTQTPTPVAADTAAPLITQLAALPSPARPGKRIRFRFQLSEAARLRIEIQRALPGRRDRGVCRRPTSGNRKRPRCTRFKRVVTLAAEGTAGTNSVTFPGRVNGRVLPAGRYRALVSATDAAGNRATPRKISFSVRAR